jgi:hypothetical protein
MNLLHNRLAVFGILVAAVSISAASATYSQLKKSPATDETIDAQITTLDGSALPRKWPVGVPLAMKTKLVGDGVVHWEIEPQGIADTAVRWNNDRNIVISNPSTDDIHIRLLASNGKSFSAQKGVVKMSASPQMPDPKPITPPPPQPEPAKVVPPTPPEPKPNEPPVQGKPDNEVKGKPDEPAPGKPDSEIKRLKDEQHECWLQLKESEFQRKAAEMEIKTLRDRLDKAQAQVTPQPETKTYTRAELGMSGEGSVDAIKRPDGRFEVNVDGKVYIIEAPATESAPPPPSARANNPSVPWKR